MCDPCCTASEPMSQRSPNRLYAQRRTSRPFQRASPSTRPCANKEAHRDGDRNTDERLLPAPLQQSAEEDAQAKNRRTHRRQQATFATTSVPRGSSVGERDADDLTTFVNRAPRADDRERPGARAELVRQVEHLMRDWSPLVTAGQCIRSVAA